MYTVKTNINCIPSIIFHFCQILGHLISNSTTKSLIIFLKRLKYYEITMFYYSTYSAQQKLLDKSTFRFVAV